jgi:hypothetical protein
MLGRAASGIRFNEHLDPVDGPLVFHMPAGSGWKASCQSAGTRRIVPAARRTGGSLRTQTRLLCGARPKRTGGNGKPQSGSIRR